MIKLRCSGSEEDEGIEEDEDEGTEEDKEDEDFNSDSDNGLKFIIFIYCDCSSTE